MTCRWKWKTVCQASLPQELRRLTPSAPSLSLTCCASRRAMRAHAARSSSSMVSRLRVCSRGTTSTWPRVAGLMSMKATVRSSSATFVPGSSPATILQKMQSGSVAMSGGRLIPSRPVGADRKLMEDAIRRLERIERPSTSPGEREAAEWIAAALAELGLQARVETERVHGTFMLPLALLNAIGIVASVVRPRLAGRLLAAAAGALLVDDL